MPKSRKRGGQKAHNKRVNSRKQHMLHAAKKMQEMYTNMLKTRMEELQTRLSGMTDMEEITENVETTNDTTTVPDEN